MKNRGSFGAGMLTMLLIISLVGTVSAASATITKQLAYRDIKISLDGQYITPKDANGKVVEPFIIDGTTYLPVRAVGEAMGLDVAWDGGTSTVILTTPGKTQPTAPPATPAPTALTAESALTALKAKMAHVASVVVYDETTDPNGNLGRPGGYIGKGDFFDDRIEDAVDSSGTIEFFASEADCQGRYEYLCAFADPQLGVFGVNQYIYKYRLAVFRVSHELTPSQAAEYKTAMDAIIGEVSTQYIG